MQYDRDDTAYGTRQEQIAAIQAANQQKLMGANKMPTGGVVGHSGSVGPGGAVVASWSNKAQNIRTPNGWVRNYQSGREDPYQFIQRLGQRGFGLRNDPGNSQTFGGSHHDGSEHYDHRAVDFGNALNNQQQLSRFRQFMRQLGFDSIDEGDHTHTSMPGSGI